jgi:hypothetical protein
MKMPHKGLSVAILALKKRGMGEEGPESESEDMPESEDSDTAEDSMESAIDAVSDSMASAIESGDKDAIKRSIMNLASILRK